MLNIIISLDRKWPSNMNTGIYGRSDQIPFDIYKKGKKVLILN